MGDVVEGDKAPAFSLPDQNLVQRSQGDVKGKWLILYFYPKDNTPGCSIEAHDFSVLRGKFESVGGVVWGVSPDSAKSHCAFINKKDLSLTLLSDENRETLKRYGAWGKKKFMGKEYEGVIRSTFLIGPDGIVVRVWREVRVKDHAVEVLSILKRIIREKGVNLDEPDGK